MADPIEKVKEDLRAIFDEFQKEIDAACDKLAMDLGVGK